MEEDLETTLEELRQKGTHWYKVIEEFPERFGFPPAERMNHYSHIIGNLISPFASFDLLTNEEIIEEHKELIESAKRVDKAYEIYFELLEEFLEFRKAEFKKYGDGYFPDIEDKGPQGAENYVFEAEKRLRGKNET